MWHQIQDQELLYFDLKKVTLMLISTKNIGNFNHKPCFSRPLLSRQSKKNFNKTGKA